MEYGFRKYDRNGDGFITLQEYLEPVTVRDQFRALDVKRDGRISRDEFLEGEARFCAMDRDNDGFITWEEFWRVMSRIQKKACGGRGGEPVEIQLALDIRRIRTP